MFSEFAWALTREKFPNQETKDKINEVVANNSLSTNVFSQTEQTCDAPVNWILYLCHDVVSIKQSETSSCLQYYLQKPLHRHIVHMTSLGHDPFLDQKC